MKDIAVTFTDNKRIIKINEYKALFTEKNNNNAIKSIKYKKRLINYEENYEKFILY